MIQWAEDILVVGLLISTMLAMGLTVNPEAYNQVLKNRWTIFWAAVINLLLIPLFAAGMAWTFDIRGSALLGLLFVASVPGGGTGTLLTYHARGDVAFSVVLLVVLTLISAFVAPFMVVWLSDSVIMGNMVNFALTLVATLVVFQILPLLLGLWVRNKSPDRAQILAPLMARLSTGLLVVLVVLLIVVEGHRLQNATMMIVVSFGAVIAFSLLAMIRWPGQTVPVHAALSLTTSTRNLSAALLLAAFFGGDPWVELSVLIYGILMYMLSIPVIMLFRANIKP